MIFNIFEFRKNRELQEFVSLFIRHIEKIGSRMFDTRKTSFTRKTSSDMAVLVTGSNKGIGFQIIRTLARQKYRDFQGRP